jgi:hypothetical protein
MDKHERLAAEDARNVAVMAAIAASGRWVKEADQVTAFLLELESLGYTVNRKASRKAQ